MGTGSSHPNTALKMSNRIPFRQDEIDKIITLLVRTP